MIYKLCNKCKRTILYPNKYCFECLKIVEVNQEILKSKRNSRYNKTRDTKYKEFYNSKAWRMLKDKKLQDEQYRCEYDKCNKFATEVHHIIPIQIEAGWNRRLDYDNLMCLCVEHHNLKHNRFQKRRGGVSDEIKANCL